MKITKMQTGFCPEQQQNATIKIIFSHVSAPGAAPFEYKKRGFYCNYHQNCHTCQNRGADCPLFRMG